MNDLNEVHAVEMVEGDGAQHLLSERDLFNKRDWTTSVFSEFWLNHNVNWDDENAKRFPLSQIVLFESTSRTFKELQDRRIALRNAKNMELYIITLSHHDILKLKAQPELVEQISDL